MEAARSRFADVDFALETTLFARYNILYRAPPRCSSKLTPLPNMVLSLFG